jgi:hypothetical protein
MENFRPPSSHHDFNRRTEFYCTPTIDFSPDHPFRVCEAQSSSIPLSLSIEPLFRSNVLSVVTLRRMILWQIQSLLDSICVRESRASDNMPPLDQS